MQARVVVWASICYTAPMVITYYGHEFFKLQFGDTVIAVNPISKQSLLKQTKFGADIVLLGSQNDPNKNGVDMVIYGEKAPFVISGPGEYEVGGIFVKGANITPENTEPGKHPFMTAYWILLEGMRLCFLNGLSTKHLSKETREMIGEVDILFVPIGGGEVLAASLAHEVAVSLEPKMIIPMHFDDTNKKEGALMQFLKEAGAEEIQPVDKLTIKKKDVAEANGAIVVLSS
ncbi:MAG: Zn-dependent hydrolase of the beta-lactamase fold-like protein [Parcubacteria group bacterium Greene0416_14]|nr:MAG: Zn-dependent hydrolase of the beta-lactamase fold-like protein [Parcubacteria group bacterium Greene0416_14]TSC98974.1 MAG: Zn-dependent hydrolase of the beta-lactamase fold-like protein [Parcubacteria group bacterium Greene1014_15]TSD06585.1 MAG: Zn-dependent hydrolase of the beta-lactamase fold-like protein [Parcubacteria group bacterium Greene0714_4]